MVGFGADGARSDNRDLLRPRIMSLPSCGSTLTCGHVQLSWFRTEVVSPRVLLHRRSLLTAAASECEKLAEFDWMNKPASRWPPRLGLTPLLALIIVRRHMLQGWRTISGTRAKSRLKLCPTDFNQVGTRDASPPSSNRRWTHASD